MRHSRRWTQVSPISRHSLQPLPLGLTCRISPRWEHFAGERDIWITSEKNSLRSLAFGFQKLLRFEGGHAAGTGSGDRLAIAPVLHVAARVDARHSGKNVLVGDQISVLIGFQLALEHSG